MGTKTVKTLHMFFDILANRDSLLLARFTHPSHTRAMQSVRAWWPPYKTRFVSICFRGFCVPGSGLPSGIQL